MFIGIDLGTSSLKAILLNRQQQVVCEASQPLAMLAQPAGRAAWREQDMASWWTACQSAIRQLLDLASAGGTDIRQIEAIGLCGQMHGAVALDRHGQVLRPAILWNDSRAVDECRELLAREPQAVQITGNLIMPGFTAPKLLWLARHEPQLFEKIAMLLLPKDWLRYQLTGEFVSDMSDASGTMWLDVQRRCWSEQMISACDMQASQLPALLEGPQISGYLRPDLARNWGLLPIPVVAGAGDNAAAAIGLGVLHAGQSMLSLGSSGVYFEVSDQFHARPELAVHSFCHALPQRWHWMSVSLAAASCLDFSTALYRYADVAALIDAAGQSRAGCDPAAPLFLPYLNGERTPHNNPNARAVFFGLSGQTERADLALATLEGVGFALRMGMEAVRQSADPAPVVLTGGGARSPFWAQMLANISGRCLVQCQASEHGAALGAARLAYLGIAAQHSETIDAASICQPVTELARYTPDRLRQAHYGERFRRFCELYRQLEPLFDKPS